MAKLKVVEATDTRLVLRMGALPMVLQFGLCITIVMVVAASLTLFLRHYIGIFAYIFIGLPGIVGVVCGLFGCANARKFTFTFDRTRGEFSATAGGATIVQPLSEVQLVHIERVFHSAAVIGDSTPSYAVALLFQNGYRCRLEGGVSASGSGRGPDHLHASAEKIRQFLHLPQHHVPVLNVTKAHKEDDINEAEAHSMLSKWLTCQGISPQLEPPLREYDWVEAPEGIVGPFPMRPPLNDAYGQQFAPGNISATSGVPVVTPYRPQVHRHAGSGGMNQFSGTGPIVVGRVHNPQPHAMQIVVPEGSPGQNLTVMSPDNTQVMVMVPADMRPGETLTIQY